MIMGTLIPLVVLYNQVEFRIPSQRNLGTLKPIYYSSKENVTIYNEDGDNEIRFSSSAEDPRQIIDWLPRIFLLCALFHLFPRFYWEQKGQFQISRESRDLYIVAKIIEIWILCNEL